MLDVNLGGPLLLDPNNATLKAAKIISYAVHSPVPGGSQANVTGFIAGKQLRGSTVENWLNHTAILRRHLTRVEGERTAHPKIIEFLKIPAADVSACAQAAQSQPVTPGYNLRVDLRESSNPPRNKGGRPRLATPAAVPHAVLGQSSPRSAQDGAGTPLLPQPSAPTAHAGLLGGLLAAETGQRDATNGSQRPTAPTPETQPHQGTAGADSSSDPLVEQTSEQEAFYVGTGIRQRIRQNGPDALPRPFMPQPWMAQSATQNITVSQNHQIYHSGRFGPAAGGPGQPPPYPGGWPGYGGWPGTGG